MLIFLLAAFSLSVSSANPLFEQRIEKYKKEIVRSEREKVLAAIRSDLEVGPWPNHYWDELKKIQRESSELFLTEKAQHFYETGLSLHLKNDSRAIESLTKARELEGDNFKVMTVLARAHLTNKECDNAALLVKEIKEKYSLLEEGQLLAAQVFVCHNDLLKLKALLADSEAFPEPYKSSYLMLVLRTLDLAREHLKAKRLVQELRKIDSQLPEVYYWLWKTEVLPIRSEFARKYLNMCEALSVRVRKKYLLEPYLCSSVDEVKGQKNNG